MKYEDLIWGGNNKITVTLVSNLLLPTDEFIFLEYGYEEQKYRLQTSLGASSEFILSNKDEQKLNSLFPFEHERALLVKVIEQENRECILELKIFESEIILNRLQAIDIQISERVKSTTKLKNRNSDLTVIEYLDSLFKYKNRIFVQGKGSIKNQFYLLNRHNRLLIKRIDNHFEAIKLEPYDENRAPYDTATIIRGEVNFRDNTQGDNVSNEVLSCLEKGYKIEKYMAIWDTYNKLEEIYCQQKIQEQGILQFTTCKCNVCRNYYEYAFTLTGDITQPFEKGEQIEISFDKNLINDANNEYTDLFSKTTLIGEFDKIESNKCYVRNYDRIVKKINQPGLLLASSRGDKIRLRRRQAAQKKLSVNGTPIKNLRSLICEQAYIDASPIRQHSALSNKLLRTFPQYQFNQQQIEAISVALNSPDVALILGPPGTGKTTVIRAIINRFEEIFKKEYGDRIPHILITSFQHEAVENVMNGLESNGLPSNRIGGKNIESMNGENSLREWIHATTQTITKENKVRGFEDDPIESVADLIYSWKQRGKNNAEGIELLKTLFQKYELYLSDDLINEINLFLIKSNLNHPNIDIENRSLENLQNKLKTLLSSQVSSQSDFLSDGLEPFMALRVLFLNYAENLKRINIPLEPMNGILNEVFSTQAQDEHVFNQYVETVENYKNLMEHPCAKTSLNSSSGNAEALLQKLHYEARASSRRLRDDRNLATAYVLRNYLEQIQDIDTVRDLVNRYSNISAATCQQVRSKANTFLTEFDSAYDLVIVDEAARANPLDLLIPLVSAEKIVLVGDFLQLPHMLEPDVVKKYKDDKDSLDDLKILEESLFERLFHKFNSSESSVKRTASLSQQYRMHSVIGNFASEVFYKQFNLDSSLVDDNKKFANVGLYKDKPIAWLGVDKAKFSPESGGLSKFRPCEAERIIREIRKVTKNSHEPKSIGVITFYKAQSDLIYQMLQENFNDDELQKIHVGTVDAFQGKEFDIVYLSCVRANYVDKSDLRRKVGHISDMHRLCVAFTRARQLFVAVGDEETVSNVHVFRKFIEQCKNSDEGYYEE